jgi:hypothetical protein
MSQPSAPSPEEKAQTGMILIKTAIGEVLSKNKDRWLERNQIEEALGLWSEYGGGTYGAGAAANVENPGWRDNVLSGCTLNLCKTCTGKLLSSMSWPPRPTVLRPSTTKRAITRRLTGIPSEPWIIRTEPTNSQKRFTTSRAGLRPSHNRSTYARFSSESC